MEIPDGGLVFSCRTLEAVFLCHSVTRERCRLPAGTAAVRISADNEGNCIVALDGIAQWANDLLVWSLAKSDDGMLVIVSGDEVLPLQDYLWSHERVHVPIAFAGKDALLAMHKFAHTQADGARCWWGLSSLWLAMQVQGLKPHQWLSNWVRWWRKRFDKLGLERVHLRPSCVARDGQAPRAHDRSEADCLDVSEQCLPELSCSTLGLLLLVSRFASVGNNRKNQDVVGVWGALFRSMCRECLPAGFAIGFSIDEAFAVKTGFCSAPAIVLQCDGERVELGGLVGNSSLFACRLRAAATGESIPLLDLALYLDTTKDSHLLLQLLWQVAIAMEKKIIESAAEKGVVQVSRSSRTWCAATSSPPKRCSSARRLCL